MSEPTYRSYVERNFRPHQLVLIDFANAVIEEYEGARLAMSLRQLYYQLVVRNIIENNARSYDNLGAFISDGRLAGLISWTAIEDRGRYLQGHTTHLSPKEGLKWLRAEYKRDLWADQPCRVEVRLEKQALEGVVGSVCDDLRVSFTSLKGYSSQSETWRAGRRYASYIQRGQRPVVLHLGDHDPSGIDMTRDNEERLAMFAGTPIQVIRIALNMAQVEELNLPPNYAKVRDSRYASYTDKYGEECWELDALSPRYLHDLITESVKAFRDEAKWDAALAQEARDLNDLDVLIEEM